MNNLLTFCSATEPSMGIFGVDLITSMPYANVAIWLFDKTGEKYIYGNIPIVVAKCVVFLKEKGKSMAMAITRNYLQQFPLTGTKGTHTPGALTVLGDERRVTELRIAFYNPPRWGKGLDWSGYTIFDAATILHRYLGSLPEPLIPNNFAIRLMPLWLSMQHEDLDPSEVDSLMKIYQSIFHELPPLNRQLVLYLLDVFSIFNSVSDLNGASLDHIAEMYHDRFFHLQHTNGNPSISMRQKFALRFLITVCDRLNDDENERMMELRRPNQDKLLAEEGQKYSGRQDGEDQTSTTPPATPSATSIFYAKPDKSIWDRQPNKLTKKTRRQIEWSSSEPSSDEETA